MRSVRAWWSDLQWHKDGGFPGGASSKASACYAGDLGSIPGSGRCPGEQNGYPLQYTCLENSMDRRAWQVIVHGVAKSRTQLKWLSMQRWWWWWFSRQVVSYSWVSCIAGRFFTSWVMREDGGGESIFWMIEPRFPKPSSNNTFFFFFTKLFLYLFWFYWVFVAVCKAFCNCSEWGLLSSCNALSSHCGDFSCCGATST